MKLKDLPIEAVIQFCNAYEEDTSMITVLISSAKAYISGETGLNETSMGEKEDLTIAVLVLVNEMYENRSYTVNNDKANVIVKDIIDSYCMHLL